MNALVTGEELGRLLRADQPISRATIWRWTCENRFPKDVVVHLGRRVLYRVPRLIESGWLMPQPAAVDAK